jgi:hypothetical protein
MSECRFKVRIRPMAHPVVRAAVMDWGSPVEPIDQALEIAGPSRIRQHPELAVLRC